MIFFGHPYIALRSALIILSLSIIVTTCVSVVKAQELKSPPLFDAPVLQFTENAGCCEAKQDNETAGHIILSKNDNYYFNINQLAEKITRGVLTDREKVDGIFMWIVQNVDYDQEAYLKGASGSFDPQEIILKGKAMCTGFSNLFFALCKLNGLEARIVTGYATGAGYSTGTRFELPNHAWNTVKINGKWRLVDASWASAYRMHMQKNSPEKYGKALSLSAFAAFYLTRPDIFILNHLPEDPVWQLLDHPVSLTAFEKGKEFIQKEMHDAASPVFDFEAEISRTDLLDSLDSNIRVLERSIENQFNQYREYNLGIAYYYKACHLMDSTLQHSSAGNGAMIRQANAFYKKSLSLLSGLHSDNPDFQFALLLTDNIKSRINAYETRVVF